jgi:hypothetical protein
MVMASIITTCITSNKDIFGASRIATVVLHHWFCAMDWLILIIGRIDPPIIFSENVQGHHLKRQAPEELKIEEGTILCTKGGD